jgi:festuclavine dehydrogenase
VLTSSIENFSTQKQHLKSIREENKIYSATGSGKIPWVATRDIAAIAQHALTAPGASKKEFLVLGEELYTYTDVRSPVLRRLTLNHT